MVSGWYEDYERVNSDTLYELYKQYSKSEVQWSVIPQAWGWFLYDTTASERDYDREPMDLFQGSWDLLDL